MPPVKLACLSCRNARIRCDGACPCYNCLSREQTCQYKPSRRGGARVRASHKPPPEDVPVTRDFEKQFGQIEHLLSPGAGLKRPNLYSECSPISPPNTACVLRAYSDNESLLNAYYLYVHPFFPVLPPPTSAITADNPIAWSPRPDLDLPLRDQSSPLALALSAVLVLIRPSGNGPVDSPSFLDLRTRFAQSLAKKTLEQVEVDADLSHYQVFRDSAFILDGAAAAAAKRVPFHPLVPVELESIAALLVLGNYEHMQRANLVKMTARVSQALVLARSLSLHRQPQIGDEYAEARRRIWWMTYAHGKLCAIVCYDVFAGSGDDAEITTPYPRFGNDSEIWSTYIEAIRLSVSTVAFANAQKASLKSTASPSIVYQDMARLDAEIHRVQSRMEAEADESSLGWEVISARVLRRLTRIKLASSRIRLHRQHAYSDIPLFVRDTCDMVLPHQIENTAVGSTTTTEVDSITYKSPASLSPSSSSSHGALTLFDQSQSADICTDAALSITRQLRQLSSVSNPSLLPQGVMQQQLPCMVPTSTCCAMQASYALLMQLCSVRVLARSFAGDALGWDGAERLEEELKHGLEGIISTLGNYAETYDAIKGMRDEIQSALHEAG